MKTRLVKASSMQVALDHLALMRDYAPRYWKRNWQRCTILIEVY